MQAGRELCTSWVVRAVLSQRLQAVDWAELTPFSYRGRKQLLWMWRTSLLMPSGGGGDGGDVGTTREEFRQGCDYLNQVLPPDERLTNVDRLLDLLDFDHSNSIEVNEFFEVWLAGPAGGREGGREEDGTRRTSSADGRAACLHAVLVLAVAGLPPAGPEGRQAGRVHRPAHRAVPAQACTDDKQLARTPVLLHLHCRVQQARKTLALGAVDLSMLRLVVCWDGRACRARARHRLRALA